MGIPTNQTPTNNSNNVTTVVPEVEGEPVDYEKRYKDIQLYATKLSQQNAEYRARQTVYDDTLPELIKPALTEEQEEELAELLDVNPEAWRARKNKLEEEAKALVTTKVDQATTKAMQEAVLKLREEQLTTFMGDSSTILTPDDLDKIPVGVVKQLEEGKIGYVEFLQLSDNYLKQALQPGSTPKAEPDLTRVGGTGEGGSTPSQMSYDLDSNDIF